VDADRLDPAGRAGGPGQRHDRPGGAYLDWGTGADGTTGPQAGLGPDAAVLPAVAPLAEVPGISEAIAIGLIAEAGLDMERFPAPGQKARVATALLMSFPGECSHVVVDRVSHRLREIAEPFGPT
jgi:hypothetical protein